MFFPSLNQSGNNTSPCVSGLVFSIGFVVDKYWLLIYPVFPLYIILDQLPLLLIYSTLFPLFNFIIDVYEVDGPVLTLTELPVTYFVIYVLSSVFALSDTYLLNTYPTVPL